MVINDMLIDVNRQHNNDYGLNELNKDIDENKIVKKKKKRKKTN